MLFCIGFCYYLLSFIFKNSILVDRHIDLESHDLTEGILGELLGTHLEYGYLLIRYCGEVVLVDVLLEVGVDILDAVLGDVVLVGINLGNDSIVLHASLALSLVNNDVDNAGNRDELCLNLLGVNILTVGEDDEVLLTAGNVDLTVLAELTVVAGLEVSVLGYSVSSCLLVLVVAEHYVATLNPDLTLAVFVRLVDLDLVYVTSGTYATGDNVVRMVARDDGCALGNAVAVEYLYTYSVKEG